MSVLATLSTDELAVLVGKSGDWVERRVAREGHEHLRVGRAMRFTGEQAEAFIDSFTVRPADAGASAAPEPPTDPRSDPLGTQSSRSRSRHR